MAAEKETTHLLAGRRSTQPAGKLLMRKTTGTKMKVGNEKIHSEIHLQPKIQNTSTIAKAYSCLESV